MYASTINKVHSTLKTARDSGALSHFVGLYFGEQDANLNLSKPAMLVKMDDPFIDPSEDWQSIRNRKEGFFRVIVVVISDAVNRDFPYGKPGDANKRGILTDVKDVLNQLDTDRDAIVAASSKNIDMNVSGRRMQNIGGRTWEAELVLIFKQRFTTGGR